MMRVVTLSAPLPVLEIGGYSLQRESLRSGLRAD